jgi:hypothetical protein
VPHHRPPVTRAWRTLPAVRGPNGTVHVHDWKLLIERWP